MQYAIVFPGQGSQAVGMLSDCFECMPRFAEIVETASAVLGYDVKQLVLEGPADTLNTTTFTQPVLLAVSYGLWREWVHHTANPPRFLAGHSLGEYTALVASGAISFEAGLQLVATRARLMQAAVPAGEGAMAAVLGLEDAVIQSACEAVAKEMQSIVSPANFNTIGQTVIAGSTAAVTAAGDRLKALGAKKIVPLAVSVPSHCALMNRIRDEFTQAILDCQWQMPTIPVLHNATVQVANTIDALQAALIDQLSQPVRWVESMQWLADKGITHVIECGPNKVLQGLIKRIDPRITAMGFQSEAEIKAITIN